MVAVVQDSFLRTSEKGYLVRWIAAFLQGRSQSVRIGSDSSNIRSLNEGIPQGTKLGPVLFSVMVNDLVSTWPKRAK